MSNGFIYVVDAHFLDKIEEEKNPRPKCLWSNCENQEILNFVGRFLYQKCPNYYYIFILYTLCIYSLELNAFIDLIITSVSISATSCILTQDCLFHQYFHKIIFISSDRV